MKMNKFFMLAVAALTLTACSTNDEDGNVTPSGYGAVTITVANPAMSRSVGATTEGTSVAVIPATGTDVTIVLTDGTNNIEKKIAAADWNGSSEKKVTFWNITNPTKVTVSMNGGVSSYASSAPTTFTGNPANIPVYGETTSFTLSGDTGSPTGSDFDANNNDSDKDKVYQLYKATVTMAIPVARLEVSGITHVTTETGENAHNSGNCAYNQLTLAGVYLDKVYAAGTGVTYANGSFPCVTGSAVTNYSYDGTHGVGIEAILKDAISDEEGSLTGPTDFLTEDGVWPVSGNSYAYYFFGADGADNLPKFKMYFSDSESKDETSPLPAPRYAMITKYYKEDGTEITKFEPGHIYQIKEAKLIDSNIIGDEEGNTLYGVEVTVKEASWTVETITADWAE